MTPNDVLNEKAFLIEAIVEQESFLLMKPAENDMNSAEFETCDARSVPPHVYTFAEWVGFVVARPSPACATGFALEEAQTAGRITRYGIFNATAASCADNPLFKPIAAMPNMMARSPTSRLTVSAVGDSTFTLGKFFMGAYSTPFGDLACLMMCLTYFIAPFHNRDLVA